MKINIYIDGFNLYYGSLKGTPYNWLDLRKMCKQIFPKDKINQIKYFIARVAARPHDPNQPIRQETYFRALRTIDNLEIIEGRFLTKPVEMPSQSNPRKMLKVIKTEEKGSDVNLGVHMLRDGYNREYELAVMITNDSDLLEPMRIVQEELKLPVGIVNPQKRVSFHLKQGAHFIKHIRPNILKTCQFPSRLKDDVGSFYKPKSW